MPVIDNIKIDESNSEFFNAYNLIKTTNKCVYITGRAGTGKTTFLKYLKASLSKNTVVLAPTGVAAINANGQTLHSFFQIPPGEIWNPKGKLILKYNKYKKEMLNRLELLIIDEISMVRADMLDRIDSILRKCGNNSLPFGGKQVVMIGDTFQLPPIVKKEEWDVLQRFYKGHFFFHSLVLSKHPPLYIELKKVYRQQEKEFIELLNKIRMSHATTKDLELINKRFQPNTNEKELQGYIRLASTNTQVDSINQKKLNELNSKLFSFEGKVDGKFLKDSKLPTNSPLHLKEGAQVMTIKNDTSGLGNYYNGKIGKIESIKDNKVVVVFPDKNRVDIKKATWENISYSWDEERKKITEEVIGTFTQYPLKLAWAITVHKSQGLTFDRVYADLSNAFAEGQVYVALSRCTSINGLILKSKIKEQHISVSQFALDFAKAETPQSLIEEEIKHGKANFFYKKTIKVLKNGDFENAYSCLMEAISYRNDIETELFRKHFLFFSKYYYSFKERNLELRNLNQKVLPEQIKNSYVETEYKRNIQKLELTNKKEQQKNISKIEEYEKEIKELTQRVKIEQAKRSSSIKEYENNIRKLKSDIENLTKALNIKRERILELRKNRRENIGPPKGKRLSKVARELNVSISTLVGFLEGKGIEISSSPNTKLEAEHYKILCQEFANDRIIKNESDKIEVEQGRKKTISINSEKNNPNKSDYNLTTRFDFGKHEGETLYKILEEDPNYVAWCLEEVDHFYLNEMALELLISKNHNIPYNDALTIALGENTGENKEKGIQDLYEKREQKWRTLNKEKY